ncbi:bifunctional 2-polyprenyl-6-hydroxyphenol methylase/3-demethylubiquinol 3-O-methyltransferase UbiG [Nocardia sp. CNY236]|uniref:class I SAM-dependent methyltransferase n=1 Tax=Nocardia sp. CNY236 TaxID=1169152 RepID=UPI00048F0F9B|nr:class I SAM-dependent methyltransferase [Nocardia sp. CNY236]
MTLLAWIERFNRRHPWSHNDFYGSWVVDQVAESGAPSVLDIGCGTGNLIERLRGSGRSVTGFEPDPATARLAMARFAADHAVTIEKIGYEQRDPARRWAAITLVASLHHLPLAATLQELRSSLLPGGRMVVIGCYRSDGGIDHAIAAMVVPMNLLIGLIKHPRSADRLPDEMTAPTADPGETLQEIRAAVAEHLPGARIRRRLFWRYSLVYDKPVHDRPSGSNS